MPFKITITWTQDAPPKQPQKQVQNPPGTGKRNRRKKKRKPTISPTLPKSKWWILYRRYIKSKEWFAKRELALKHYGRKCQKCTATKSLHVHHLTYARLGNEALSDVMVLCKSCHEKEHGREFDKIT